MERQLVICRHTQTDHNFQRRYTGQMNIPVNTTGRKQAQRLADRIAELPGICGILSSDLRRTMYLAKAIGHRTGFTPIALPALREVALGTLEGLTKKEVAARHPGTTFRTSDPQFDFRAVGGEQARDVIRRQLQALQRAETLFASAAAGQMARVIVVGHGTALRLLFRDHLRLIGSLHEQGDCQEVVWKM